ncbi:COX15/CtaA family protein [Microlunatus speluncae]|uniref:COX15/CtaA family protein n=1 Tax=Microlunatus speluncae TaxID=2594267 RepID=UPI001FE64A6F|nr:COX15/CtaA family protein [Microlunatus speluncae]
MSEQPVALPGPWAEVVRRWRAVTAADVLPRWATAALVANIGIVLTGGLVRLTDSGLGCPTWPRCTAESYVPHAALGVHGVIEFGNRLLFFVLAAIMIMTFFTALRVNDRGTRPRMMIIALVMGLGIPAQGVVGGLTVLSQLNPFVVAFHFLVSMGLIALSVLLVHRARGVAGVPVPTIAHRVLVIATFVVVWVALWLGTVVTGSGPHSGDINAKRTGFDPTIVTHVHAASVYLLLALTVLGVILFRSRAVVLLLAVELFQGLVGVIQFNTGLPIVLVLLHLVGAALAVAAATHYLLTCQKPVVS